ncbi:MAG TPA: adenylyltransferase/cytidyltransferase family protein [Methanoregulaceae archaeon]|nr:adenylyltransferase/cytidyltransferase family protein [Methanoregulaceae archaeon]
MTRVVATGTFDIIHPGHLFYLRESKNLGDELFVIVARDANVRHKPRPVIHEDQRRNIVASLKPVDHAVLGDLQDMFRPIREINPDIITIGYNQHFDVERLKRDLADHHLNADVVRIGTYTEDQFCSSRLIVAEILKRAGCEPEEDREES